MITFKTWVWDKYSISNIPISISLISEFSTLHVLMTCFGPSFLLKLAKSHPASNQKTNFYITRHMLLMVLSFARDRITQMAEKISFMIALTITSLEDRATRRSYIGVLCQVCIGNFFRVWQKTIINLYRWQTILMIFV